MMDPVGAHEYTAPWRLFGSEKKRELSVQVCGLASEKGAQHKAGISLEGFPQPSVWMGPWGRSEQAFEPIFHREAGILE